MNILELYARHDPLTDPGGYVALYRDLPTSPPRLREVVSNLITHVSWLQRYGISACSPITRETQPIERRLEAIQAASSQPLATPRALDRRSFGTCRDFALLLCSMLRHQAIAARVRCGFATYLFSGRYEDHWICEHWDAGERRWVRTDAQLDPLHRTHLEITFDPANIPQANFVTAEQAWQMARSGAAAPDDFGHGIARGLWFLRVNVHRDLLALTNRHMSAWDGWREATTRSKILFSADLAHVDRLAHAMREIVADGDMSPLIDLAGKSQLPPWKA